MVKILKKNGLLEDYDFNKIVNAVTKSANRTMVNLTKEDFKKLQETIELEIELNNEEIIDNETIHLIVENALENVNDKVAKSYKDYRNYKKDFKAMLKNVLNTAEVLQYSADHNNANADSELVSTKRSLIYKALSKEMYRKFFLSEEELQAIDEGYIYIHDIADRSTTMNCCLFDMGKVLQGGFEMENMHYNEPTTISSAINVLCDVAQMAGGLIYGGFTIPEIDTILEPYVEKSYKKYYTENLKTFLDTIEFLEKKALLDSQERHFENLAHEKALKQIQKDLEQGFQSLEYNLNTVASSRGDFIFTTLTFGLDDRPFGRMVSSAILKVRKEGQGKEGYKKPAIFPKLVFLYDKEKHSEGQELYDLFLEAVDCSCEAQYPDFLSLSGDGYVADTYKKYKNGVMRWYLGEDNKVKENENWVDNVISPMGKRKLSSSKTF